MHYQGCYLRLVTRWRLPKSSKAESPSLILGAQNTTSGRRFQVELHHNPRAGCPAKAGELHTLFSFKTHKENYDFRKGCPVVLKRCVGCLPVQGVWMKTQSCRCAHKTHKPRHKGLQFMKYGSVRQEACESSSMAGAVRLRTKVGRFVLWPVWAWNKIMICKHQAWVMWRY